MSLRKSFWSVSLVFVGAVVGCDSAPGPSVPSVKSGESLPPPSDAAVAKEKSKSVFKANAPVGAAPSSATGSAP